MSKVNVNTIEPSTGTDITLGASGDTITVPSGATITNSGTATGFGVSLANGVDNRIVTSSSATALNGETNFIYNGTIVGAGADGANADLGQGIHIKASDSGGSAASNEADFLIIEKNSDVGMQFLSSTSGTANIYFGDSGDNNIGRIQYAHGSNVMYFTTNAAERMRITSGGNLLVGSSTASTGYARVSLVGGHADGTGANSGIQMTYNAGAYGGGAITTPEAEGGGLKFWNFTGNVGSESYSQKMQINASGDVSIGSTATTAKFNVATTGGSGYFHNTGSSFGANNLQSAVNRFTANNSYRFFYCVNSDNVKMQVIDSGAVQNAPNSYGGISDERTKQDITDASSQWEDIKALKVRKYKLKCDVALDGENAQSQIGVVSQELEASGMSGLVLESDSTAQDVKLHSDFGTLEDGTADNGAEPIKDEDGNITGYEKLFTQGQKVKAVKYSVLYMKAIKCLQEAITKIETLETANTNKDTAIADLTTRLEALENA